MIVYFCMGNWPPAGGYEGDLIFASRNSENVTCDPCTWPSRSRETSPKNAYACDAIYTEGWIKEIRNEGMPSGWSVLEGRKKKTRTNWRRAFSHALVAIKSVWAGTSLTVAAQPSTVSGLDPWSLETDRCHTYIRVH